MVSRLHVTRNCLNDAAPRATRPVLMTRRLRVVDPRNHLAVDMAEKARRVRLYARQVARGQRIRFLPRVRDLC